MCIRDSGIVASVKKDSYEVPAIFKLLAKTGDIEEKMMYGSQTARDKLGSQKGKSPDHQLRSQSAC